MSFTSFTFHKLKKKVTAVVGRTADWALFLGIVLIGGVGSSWYMVDAGSSLTTVTVGPWTTWPSAARSDADPYTRAHYARLGLLPLSTEYAQTFVARTDSEGRGLHSSCDYTIEGQEFGGYWWSLSAFDAKGRLIPSVTDRHTYTRDTTALNPDGTFTVSLSRDPEPGNWLPVGGGGRLALVYTVIDLGVRAVSQDGDIEKRLPVIKRKSC
jgi:hypothetical protein